MQKLFYAVIVGAVLALAGCSSNQISPMGLAVYDTLETDAHLRTWVNACQQQGPELRRSAMLTYRNWWQRNGSFVESADFGLTYGIVRVSEERVETGARLASAMTWNIVQQADLDVQKKLVPNRADKACYSVLADYDSGKHDLGKKNKWHKELVELQRLKQQKGAELARQQAQVATVTGKEYGRSFYVTERLVQREGCNEADVRLIKNTWPNEVYDARCSDQSYLVIRCEWGNCRVLN